VVVSLTRGLIQMAIEAIGGFFFDAFHERRKLAERKDPGHEKVLARRAKDRANRRKSR